MCLGHSEGWQPLGATIERRREHGWMVEGPFAQKDGCVARQKDGRLPQTRKLRVGKQSSECRPVGLGPGPDSCVPMSQQAMAPQCTSSQVTVSMRAGHRATVTCAPDQSSPIEPLCPCAHQYGPIWTATTGSVVSRGVSRGFEGYEQERRCTGDPGARGNPAT